MDKKYILAKLRTEVAVPGIVQTEKVLKDDKKENNKYYKEVEKKMGKYEKETTSSEKDAIEPVMTTYTDDDQKVYHDEMEIMNGQEMIEYQNEPEKKFKDRAIMAIEGGTEMGNNPEWANVVQKGQGGDPEFGKNLVKKIKDSKGKRDAATPTMTQFGDDVELNNVGVNGEKSAKKPAITKKTVAVESKIQVKKDTIMETKKIKRLKFKKTIGGLENALAIIPESYKVDNKVFEMTDGNENYRFRWEGELNEGRAVTLKAYDKTLVESDKARMETLMGFKSDLGRPTPTQRLNENDVFTKMLAKAKALNEDVEPEGEVLTEVKKKALTEISDEKKKEHARDQHHHSDYPDGSKSNCCDAPFVDGDRCSKCKEHASPAKVNEGTLNEGAINDLMVSAKIG